MLYIVLSSWWWAEEPPETCRAFIVINIIVERWILLVMLKCIKDARSHERKKKGFADCSARPTTFCKPLVNRIRFGTKCNIYIAAVTPFSMFNFETVPCLRATSPQARPNLIRKLEGLYPTLSSSLHSKSAWRRFRFSAALLYILKHTKMYSVRMFM
jgi:hypothetical protein